MVMTFLFGIIRKVSSLDSRSGSCESRFRDFWWSLGLDVFSSNYIPAVKSICSLSRESSSG